MLAIKRRSFLKFLGLLGTTATMGCSSDSARKLIPYIIPPEEIVPGEATWYATTCRECPAGCGMLAKNRDGRIIKVEGNPSHPVNRGALCARGQASLHGLYNPERFPGPQKRVGGKLSPVSWDEGLKTLIARLKALRARGRGKRDRLFEHPPNRGDGGVDRPLDGGVGGRGAHHLRTLCLRAATRRKPPGFRNRRNSHLSDR